MIRWTMITLLSIACTAMMLSLWDRSYVERQLMQDNANLMSDLHTVVRDFERHLQVSVEGGGVCI